MSQSNRRRNHANRQNAQKSTGPKTTEGKNRSRWNALTHGLLAQSVVLPDCEELESPEQFRELLTDLTDDLKPVGIREGMLVEQIAVCYWRLRRALRMEAGNIVNRVDYHKQFNGNAPIEAASLPIPDNAHLIIRYETAIDRRLTRAQNTLERLQNQRLKKEDESNVSAKAVENKKLLNEPNSPQPAVLDRNTEHFEFPQSFHSDGSGANQPSNNEGDTMY